MKVLVRILSVLFCLTTMPASAGLLPDPAFVVMEGAGMPIQAAHDVVSAAAEVGGQVYHVMPVHGPALELTGCCLIATLPPGAEPLIMSRPFVTQVLRGPLPIGVVDPMGEEAIYAAGAYDYLLEHIDEPPPPPELQPCPDDALGPLVEGEPLPAKPGGTTARPQVGAPGQFQTSEFMISSVAIGVVLPESTGNGENWANFDAAYPGQNRRQLVYNKIVAGATWWGTQGGTAARLTFFYDQRLGVSIPLEPISISSANNGETAWVGSALTTMGFSGLTAFAQAYAYDNWMRQTYSTDWAYSVFVADSLNDSDGMFPNSASAFAYLYGPYVVMTYDNGTPTGQWALSRMNQVLAHETGHIFGAPDEYAGAGTCTCSNYGYLGVTNGNCVNCTASPVTCLMASNTLQLCTFTKGHVGWRDSDSDGILDPVDAPITFPSAYLDFYSPPYSSNPQITGHGTVQAGAWPSTIRTPVSINRVTASYSVDSTPALPTTPSDGTFDSDVESFDFTSAAQTNGTHFVLMFGSDNFGNTGSVASPIYIIIDTTSPPAPPPFATIIEAPYSSNPTTATVTWAPAPPDPESGTVGHQVTLRRNGVFAPIASLYVPLPQTMCTFGGLTLQHGNSCYADVQGVNGAGLNGAVAASAPLTIDLTPPGPPAPVLDGGAGTDQYNQLAFSWSAAPEDVSPIADYSLDITDQAGNSIWNGWMGNANTNYTAAGLSLLMGTTYTGTVRARNAAGLVGPLAASDGIMAVTFYPSIGAIKTTAALGLPVGVKGIYATSSGSYQSGVVYAEDYSRICGVRTDCTDQMVQGAQIDIAGILNYSPTGELHLSNSEVAPLGTSLAPLRPRGLTGRALGGGAMGLQPGVIGGSGLNTIGLLVQIWGNVTYSNGPIGPPYSFTLDDGSGVVDPSGIKGVLVRCGNITPPAQGAFVKAMGICSYESGYPVLLLRQAGDWW